MASARINTLPGIVDVARALGCDLKENGPGKWWIPCPDSQHDNDATRPRCGLDEEKNCFHCLKCGAGGDAVGLVKLVQGVDVKAAYRWLEEHFGKGEREAEPADPIEQLARRRNWSAAALRAMGAFARGRSVHFPMRDHKGNVLGHRIRRGDGSAYETKDGAVKALTQKNSKNGVIGLLPVPGAEECRAKLPDCSFADVVVVVEGEADAAAALTAGWPAVLATPGATPGRACKEFLQQLTRGRRVVLTPDPGIEGERWLRGYDKGGEHHTGLAEDLAAAGVRVGYVPQIEGKDLDKRLTGTPEQKLAELRRLISLAIPWEAGAIGGGPAGVDAGGGADDQATGAGLGSGGGAAGGAKPAGGGPGEDGRVEIRIGPDESRVCDEILSVLKSEAKNLYQRSGKLVTTVSATSDEAKKISRFGGLSISVVNNSWVRNTVTRHCRLMELNAKNKKWFWAHPPQWLGASLVSLKQWPGVNELFGLASYPVLTDEGIVTEERFDKQSGWLVRPLIQPAGFVARPGAEDLARARAALHEVVADFPFAHKAGEAAWLAFIFTILARPAIEGPAPLFLADASVRGSGKTLLITVGGTIALGVSPSVVPETGDNEEERKRIYSLLMAGDMAVLFDNVTKIGGSALDALLTNYPTWTDRILGASEVPKAPNLTAWAATANNPQINGDARRRILPIRLEPAVERPEERTDFRHANLTGFVAERQPELLGAALTLLSGWHEAGRPDQGLTPWGSYEAWSKVVRNCLVWLGYPDPAACRDELVVMADPDIAQLGALLDLLERHKKPIKASEIIAKISGGEWSGDDADSVKEVAQAGNGSLSARVLGKRLERWRGRVAGGKRLEARQGAGGFMYYWAALATVELIHQTHGQSLFANNDKTDCGKQTHGQSLSGADSDFATFSESLPSSLTRDHARGARTRESRRDELTDCHIVTTADLEAARELRARLAARGVVVKLEDGIRVSTVGFMADAESAELRRLNDAMRELLLIEQDGMPF